MSGIVIRPATRADAAAMTVLIDIAGYGLPSWLWSTAPARDPRQSVLDFGRRRALREEGAFTYRNAFIAEHDGQTAGMLLGYREPDEPPPSPGADAHPVLRPLFELEALAAGTWYINVLATFPEFRGRGIGSALMRKVEALAVETGASRPSLIVQDDNEGAIRIYERHGYRTVAARPFVPFPDCAPADNWLLMLRQDDATDKTEP